MIVPRLYYVPESELMDDGGTAAGSMVTFRDCMYNAMEPMMEDVPFQWAQSLFIITRLASKSSPGGGDPFPVGAMVLCWQRRAW